MSVSGCKAAEFSLDPPPRVGKRHHAPCPCLDPGIGWNLGIDRITAEMRYGEEAISEVCWALGTDPDCCHELQATNAFVRRAYQAR